MKKCIYLYLVLCCILLFPGCSRKTVKTADVLDAASGSEVAVETILSQPVSFVYPDIENKTREILERPEGEITKADLLTITEFDIEYGDDAVFDMPFLDLQWYRNLKCVRLGDCRVESLQGVERLTALNELWVRNNDITDIEPIRELTGLVKFSCAGNPIQDYSPAGGLKNLEELQIGDNGYSNTEIEFLADFTKLKSLYAPWCGISDISALGSLTELEYLNLYHNQITDVSVLKNLDKLVYLELGNNQIMNIEPLCGLNNLTHLNLKSNIIPEEELTLFYDEKRGENFTITQTGRLKEDMPVFTFELTAYYDLWLEFYEVQSVDVYEDSALLQTISIPELTLFGQTETFDSMQDTLGFELEDVNFDGYLDIRLFDNLNGNYRMEWIYLVWNPEKQQFEHDARLNEISLAVFDQEKKLIYGMERGSASSHYFSTYEYRDGEIVEIRYEAEVWLYLPNEQIKEYFDASSVETEEEEFEALYERIMEINEETGQLETVSEEYIFWGINAWEEKLHIDASSKLGKQIAEDRRKYF